MAARSQIPVLKRWFVDLLRDHLALADIESRDGIRYGYQPDEPNEVIRVMGTDTDWEQKWVGVGQDRQRDETFGIQFFVIIKTTGLEQEEANDRAFEVFGEIEELVLEYTTTKGQLDQVLWIKVDPSDFSEVPGPEGPRTLIEARLRAQTRI